jgi:hypothetical protein
VVCGRPFLLNYPHLEQKLFLNQIFFTFEKQLYSIMKKLARIFFFLLFAFIADSAFAAPIKGKDTDSAASLKSNIAIFKMITSPAAPSTAGKSLKKAGSVARTAGSHSTLTVKPVPEG